MTYEEFLNLKTQCGGNFGFEPVWIPDRLFDFQKSLVRWATLKGRGALFEACGLGKTPQALTWAENVVRKTNKNVLICTPLAVAQQFSEEGERLGVECKQSRDGQPKSKITVANYERLHLFNPNDFTAFIGDESGCLKNHDGVTTGEVTAFCRKIPYRLLATATPSPNDFVELGTSAECLGEMGYMDMLSRFFKNDQNSSHPNRVFGSVKWRFRGHAERDFWRWVCSWARAIQKPSDLGFDDSMFILPPLEVREHVVTANIKPLGFLFGVPATNFEQERDERRRTIQERCEMAAELINRHPGQSIAWCDLNPEGDILEKLIKNCAQVKGSQSPDEKEELIKAFRDGQVENLVTKTEIAGFGLNLQNCWHQTYFPNHSYERWHQSVRRSWRFGQKNKVTIDVILSEGQTRILSNQKRKSDAADQMFARLVDTMHNELKIDRISNPTMNIQTPSFLCRN